MRRFALSAVPLLLAACAAVAATPAPREVRLSDEALTIQLSDGTTCRLKNWQARPEGRFESCGGGIGYAIAVEAKPNPLRRVLEEVNGAVAGNLLAPMAQITLTDAAGRVHDFTSPAPLTDFDW